VETVEAEVSFLHDAHQGILTLIFRQTE